MNYSEEYEHYLEKEMSRCDSRYAFYQEMAWFATSEMTELEHRQEKLLADLKRLHESRELYLPQMSLLDYNYTPSQLSIQGTEVCVFTDRCAMQIQDEEVTIDPNTIC